MKRTVIATVAGLALFGLWVSQSPTEAKAKPTTTTAATTTTLAPTPTLGIPHVISSQPNSTGGILESLSCPTGEVAISFVWASIGTGPGGFFSSLIAPPPARPILTDGIPTGYEWYKDNGVLGQGHVTCAPIVS
jgi:hypothetical protein